VAVRGLPYVTICVLIGNIGFAPPSLDELVDDTVDND